MNAAPLALALSLSLAACSQKKDPDRRTQEEAEAAARAKAPADADLVVDGVPFRVASCKPGTPHKFVGFDLTSHDRRRLWISASPPGKARVHVFRTPVLPVELGRCAQADVEVLSDPVGGVAGSFTAECDALGHTVSGGLRITDCR